MTRGRPKLRVGELGSVTFEPKDGKVLAVGRTRDAAGELRRIRAVGRTEADARAKLEVKASGLGLTGRRLSAASSLADLLETWYSDTVVDRNVRPQTVRMYRVKVNKLVKRYGGYRVQDLTPGTLQKVMYDLAAQNTKEEYRVLRSTLAQALSHAVVCGVLPSNPLNDTQRPRLREPAAPVSLTAHQLQVFRQEFAAYVAEGKRFSNRRNAQLVVDMILGLGGLRISEALAIRRCDVDWENCVVDVNGTLVYVTGQPVFRQDALKRERQERFVQLAPHSVAMAALRAAHDEAPAPLRTPDSPLIGRIELGPEGPWVNPAIVTHHLDAVSWRPEVVACLAETGLSSKQLTPHTLRRSVATLVARAEDVVRASKMLGHADPRITARSYVTPVAETVDAAQLDELLGLGTTR